MPSSLPHAVDGEMEEALRIAGAVLLEGARGCRNTETGRGISRSEVLLDTDQNARAIAEEVLAVLLSGATPRLHDEWQLAPTL